MTLFGVAFKVEAKAESGFYWKNESSGLNFYYTVDEYPSSDDDDPIEYVFSSVKLTDLDGDETTAGSTSVEKIQIYKSKKIYVDGTSVSDKTVKIFSVSKDDLRGIFETADKGGIIYYKAYFTKSYGGETGDSMDSTGDVLGFKIMPMSTLNGELNKPEVVFDIDKAIILEGETATFKVTNKVSAGFKFVNWSSDCKISSSSSKSCTVKASGIPDLVNGVFINYETNPNMKLTLTKALDQAVIAEGGTIETRKYEFSGGYTGADIEKVEIDGEEADNLRIYPKDKSGKISFEIPSSVTADPYEAKEVVFKMKDENEFRDIWVYIVDPDDVEVTLDPDDSDVEVGKTVKFTAACEPAVEGAKFSFTPNTGNAYVDVKINGATITLTGKKETTTPISVTAKAQYKIEGATQKTKTSSPVSVSVVEPSFELDSTIYVNEDQSIKLSKFTGNDYTPITSVTLNKSSDYISIGKFSKDSYAKDVTIKGKKKTSSTISNGITVESKGESDNADVVVYPKPTISESTTSTSNSNSKTEKTYKFSVTMPDGDYHDNIAEPSVDKAEIVLKTSSGDEKSLGFKDLDSNGKLSFSVTSKELAEYFGDATDKEVTVYAYASYGDKKRDDKVYAKTDIKYSYNGSSSNESTDSKEKNPDGTSKNPGDPDPVPETGESKTDIWILWSVLFVAMVGAAFLIRKRLGLVRAIAEAEEAEAVAVHEEMVKAKEKEKKDKLRMLKDLRKL